MPRASYDSKAFRWRVTVQRDGVRKTFCLPDPTRSERMRLKCEEMAITWAEALVPQMTASVNMLAESYFMDMAARRKITNGSSAHEQKQRQIFRNYIAPVVGTLPLHKLTIRHMQRCVDNAARHSVSGRPLSARTLGTIREVFHALSLHAARSNIDFPNASLLRLPPLPPRPEKAVLSPSDLRELFSDGTTMDWYNHTHVGRPFYLHAWRFAVITDMRRGEIAGLRWDDLFIQDGICALKIRRSINSTGEVTHGKTAAAQRTVALSPLAYRVLLDQQAMLAEMGLQASPWVFPHMDGDVPKPNAIYKQFTAYARQKGFSCHTIHELRHTGISLAAGVVSPELLKKMVGHTRSTDTTGIYYHPFMGELQQASEQIADILNGILSASTQ